MKKITALMLSLLLCLAFCACDGGTDVSDTSDASSKPTVSDSDTVSDTQSKAESKTESSDDGSQPNDESSADTSSGDELKLPEYVSNFVTWATLGVGLRATDATSLRLTKVNQTAEYGDISVFTYDFDMTEADVSEPMSDYAFLVAEYDSSLAACIKKQYYKVGSYDGDGITIPDDGFVIAAHKSQEAMISKMASIPAEKSLYVAGVQTCDVNYSIKETSSPMAIDGVVGDEWKPYHIDKVDSTNKKWTYSMFGEELYTNADYYVTFDKEYLYLAVVVNSPYHYCPVTPDTANDMWQYECIQVKVSSKGTKSDYIMQHYDHVIDKTADTDGVVHSYGFAVNDGGETCFYESSAVNKKFPGKSVCKRDDETQLTVYEVAFPWSQFEEGTYSSGKIGLTFSINSTNEEDVANKTFKNLILRDGGAVIGRNDWAKMPEVTLVYNN